MKLLLAEDDTILADALAASLRASGFDVEVASNGAVAEYLLLRHSLAARIGAVHFRPGYLPRLWIAAVTAVLTGWTLLFVVQPPHPLVAAALGLVPFAIVYCGLALLFRIPTALALLARARESA